MKKTVSLMSALLLGACASMGGGQTMANTSESQKPTLKVFLFEQCPISGIGSAPVPPGERVISQDFLSTIGGIIVPPLIDMGVSAVSSLLKNWAEDDVENYAGGEIAYLYDLTNPGSALIGKNSQESDLSNGPIELSLSGRNRCIVAVKGHFEPDYTSIASKEFSGSDETHTSRAAQTPLISSTDKLHELETKPINDVINTLNSYGVNLKSDKEPDLIYEGYLKYTQRYEAFVLYSTFLNVQQLKTTKNGSSNKRGLGLTVTIDAPKEVGEEAKTLQAVTLDFGEVSGRKKNTTEDFRRSLKSFDDKAHGVLSRSVAPSEQAKAVHKRASDAQTSRLSKLKTAEKNTADIGTLNQQINDLVKEINEAADADKPPFEKKKKAAEDSAQAKQDENARLTGEITKLQAEILAALQQPELMPVNISATFVETKKGSQVAKFFSELFEKSKESLTEELKSELDPKARETAREEETEAQEKLEDDLSQARIAWLSARDDLEKLADDTSALQREISEEKVSAALTKYNRLRLEAGFDPI